MVFRGDEEYTNAVLWIKVLINNDRVLILFNNFERHEMNIIIIIIIDSIL